MEGENPTRRYKWFRPRQARRGYASPAAPANKQTISLFNESGSAYYLVVRDFRVRQGASDDIAIGYVTGSLGTAQTTMSNFIPGDGALPGTIYALDDATGRAGDFQITPATGVFWWGHDFPFAVLQPGQSLFFQDTTAAHAMAVALLWEAVFPDELDWYF